MQGLIRRRAFLALALPAAAAACASPGPTLVETIDGGTIRFPVTPALIVPAAILPATLPDREERTTLSLAALRAAIGERPTAEPAPDAVLLATARDRGLPRVVQMTVLRATRYRSGAFAPITTEVVIRLRVLSTATGWMEGNSTFQRRTHGTEDIAAEITALAASLLA
jgi:hypothetical protein